MSFMQLAKLKRLAKKPENSAVEESRREVNQMAKVNDVVSIQKEKVPLIFEAKKTSDWSKVVKLVDVNLENALAPSSSGQYDYWWNRFQVFCKKFDRKCLPFDLLTCVTFLSHLAENSEGIGGVDQARSALRHKHYLHFPNVVSPTESVRVDSVIKGIKRRFKKPVQKKRPLVPTDFQKLLIEITEGGDMDGIKMSVLRFAAQISVMYCTFSRYEESCALRPSDILEEGADLVVVYPKGKQYQYGEARESVMLSQPGLEVNPVVVVKSYLRRLFELGNVGGLLFPSFRYSGKKLVVLEKEASYDCVLNQFKLYAGKAGISGKPEDYGLHSCRRGAVTTAVNNGCDEHTVQKQMRVSSSSTVVRYASLSRKRLGKANKMLFKGI